MTLSVGTSEAAVRKVVEIAAGIEPVQDGCIFIELINTTFIKMGRWAARARSFAPASHLRKSARELELHESGTFTQMTKAGSGLRPVRRVGKG
ncbi:hypothetical protein ACM43_11750 [Bradyrhizobium sp. CCBAU 45321]|uniref:hypothetical protein n=1 Tax=Bradyrhizobium TaxID=374 RepID=UPI0004B9CF8A|nr:MULTISPECIES: hypothetical protein [Bradyrhizobium]MDA9545111.1 hypothetical protein [Bradyrhizobium sp. CCBAU 45321]